MRTLVALLAILSAFGCSGQRTGDSQAESAVQSVLNDRSSRIVEAALAGTWSGDDGSVLKFQPGSSVDFRIAGGRRTRAYYRLERYKLIVADVGRERAIGWIRLDNDDQLTLQFSRNRAERFVRKA